MRVSQIDLYLTGRQGLLIGVAWLLLSGTGCAGKFTPVPVSGVVTLDGNPVEGANVVFMAVGDHLDGRPAQGVTNKDGEFELSTMGDKDGALKRSYKVVINKFVPTKPNLKMPDYPDTVEGKAARQDFMYRNFEALGIQPLKNALPVQYADSEKTPLSCNVTGKTKVKFELVSK